MMNNCETYNVQQTFSFFSSHLKNEGRKKEKQVVIVFLNQSFYSPKIIHNFNFKNKTHQLIVMYLKPK